MKILAAILIALLLPTFASADVLTVYPDAGNPGTTTVDGTVAQTYGATAGVAWATIIAAAGSGVSVTANPQNFVAINSDSILNQWRLVQRGIFLYDTATLGSGSTISATVMSLFGTAKSDALAVTPDIDVYTSTPAANTTLAAGDYAQTGAVSQTGTPITYANWSTTAYNDFTFDATGRGNVSKTGISKFAVRNANYDVAAVAPTWAISASASLQANSADATGTTNDPKLVITYTTGDYSIID